MADPSGRSADLHLHSSVSDGLMSPEAVAQRAADLGLLVVALTDHDTTQGFRAFAEAARARGLVPICGAEVAAEDAGEEVHLLSYFAEAPKGPYPEILRRLAGERQERAAEMLRRLGEVGIALPQEILRHPLVGRPHVARALVARGVVQDTAEAFRRFLSPGCPAYVGRYRPPADEIVARTHGEGGVVSLAHPCRYEADHLAALQRAGIDAVEATHPSADKAARARLTRRARRRGLLVTGGSDFHGKASEEIGGESALGARDALALLRRLGMHA